MGYSIPSLVRFGQLLDPIKKDLFLNILIQNYPEIIGNFRMKHELLSTNVRRTIFFALQPKQYW